MNAVLPLKTRDAGRTPRGLPAGRVELTGRAAALVVISVDMRRGKAKPQVQVAPSPRLHVLFKDDCAWREREQLGTALVKYTWFAIRYGVHIEWEEVTCA